MLLQVNKYPGQRVFTAIGTGGRDFKECMLKAVEDTVGKVHVECIKETPSSGGKYVSVRIGPVWVRNADQVRAPAYMIYFEWYATKFCAHYCV
jgi:putative lipoic acid-binding regulatory protein